MASNIITAKNTFSEGLVMDFSPDNTQASVLTSALNATLLTFNGNEMSLQNDMGNGRVETAYLPEGYIPVGTCEFGDIIYIVSYNPLTNKSQIGCFPSPERNISSDEISQLVQSLSEADFIEGTGNHKKVIHSSVKKVLTEKELHPGDKFRIYTSNSILNQNHISDIGNYNHTYGEFPKLLKIHVVSIDDSGKMTYLDSDLSWFEHTSFTKGKKYSKDYYIAEQQTDSSNNPDLDSYRNLLSSGYSIFQSKTAGKLALYIELEQITSFSCTYNIYRTVPEEKEGLKDIQSTIYDVWFNFNWNSNNNNINPSGVCLLSQQWSGPNPDLAGNYILWNYDNKTNKYILNYTENQKKLTFPKCSYEESENAEYWYSTFSRCYKPEDNISYDDFQQSKSYNKILENSLNALYYNQYYKNNKKYKTPLNVGIYDKDGYPLELDDLVVTNPIILNRLYVSRDKNGQPEEGFYLVNADIIDNNGTYYTSYKNASIPIEKYKINDDIVNNYFKYQVHKKFASFTIPTSQNFKKEEKTITLKPDLSNLIYNFEVAPMMPYGILESLKTSGYIDFSKIGTGKIDLTQWKYYNQENTLTLTTGFNIMPEEGMGVSGIVISFMDNQGICAVYKLNNMNSYSGSFTDTLPLNNSFQNYKLSGESLYHAGIEDNNGIVHLPKLNKTGEAVFNKYLDDDGNIQELGSDLTLLVKKVVPSITGTKALVNKSDIKEELKNVKGEIVTVINDTNSEFTLHQNDAGILYSNFLYLVKIEVQYCYKNTLGEYDTLDTSNFKTFYRWLWTNSMYNENYYTIEDFDSLEFNLNLDLIAQYKSTNTYKTEYKAYETETIDTVVPTNNFGTLESKITGDSNIKSSVTLGLIDTFNTFSLSNNLENKIEVISYIGSDKIEAEDSIVTSANGEYVEDNNILYSDRTPNLGEEPKITDVVSYEKAYNWHKLQCKALEQDIVENKEQFSYISYDEEEKSINLGDKGYKGTLENLNYNFMFSYTSYTFTNFYKYYINTNTELPLYTPIIHDLNSAKKYGFNCMDPKGSSQSTTLLRFSNTYHLSTGDDTNGPPYAHYSITQMSLNSKGYQEGQGISQLDINSETNRKISINGRIQNLYKGFQLDCSDSSESIQNLSDISQGFSLLRFYSLHKKGGWTGSIGLGGRNFNGSSIYTIKMYDTNMNPSSVPFKWFSGNIPSDTKKLGEIYYGDSSAPVLGSRGTYWLLVYITAQHEVFIINNMFYEQADNLEVGGERFHYNYPTSIETSLDNIASIPLGLFTHIWKPSWTTYSYNNSVMKDIVYLQPRIITYTYDIIYRTTIKQDKTIDNEDILIKSIKYKEYIDTVLYDNKNKGINENNINVKIAQIIKNCPVIFQVTTQNVPYVTKDTTYNAVFKRITPEGEVYTPISLDIPNKNLYIQNNNNFDPYYGGNIEYKNRYYKYDSSQLKELKEGTDRQIQFSQGWTYGDDLWPIYKEGSNRILAISRTPWNQENFGGDHIMNKYQMEAVFLNGVQKDLILDNHIPRLFNTL